MQIIGVPSSEPAIMTINPSPSAKDFTEVVMLEGDKVVFSNRFMSSHMMEMIDRLTWMIREEKPDVVVVGSSAFSNNVQDRLARRLA